MIFFWYYAKRILPGSASVGIPIVGAAFVGALAVFASINQKICVSDVQIYSGMISFMSKHFSL